MIKLILAGALLVVYPSLYAAKQNKSNTQNKKANTPWTQYESHMNFQIPNMTPEYTFAAEDLKSQGEEKSLRTTAGINEMSLSEEFRNYRNRITSLTYTQTGDLHEILSELDTNYDKLKNNDTRLLAALLSPIIPLRGLLWNATRLTEGQKFQKEMFVTQVRNMYSRIRESQNLQA